MKRLTFGQHVVQWVAKQTNDYGTFGAAHGIGLQEAEQTRYGQVWRMIAGVVYEDWNRVNVVCHIAAEGKRWLTREYLWTIFDYPFNQLGVGRITVCVGEGNAASRRFCEHLGFALEARLDKAHPTGDILVYRLRKPECRWLALRKPEHEKLAA